MESFTAFSNGRSSEIDYMMKQYRRRWSVDSGYDTAEPTPLQTPNKESGFFFASDVQHTDQLACLCEVFNESAFEDNANGAGPTDPVAAIAAVTKCRPITKQTGTKIDMSCELEEDIQRVAAQLADFRIQMAGRGEFVFEDDNIYQYSYNPAPWTTFPDPNCQWKYPLSVSLASPSYDRSRHLKLITPKAYCVFCRNNGDPDYITHHCKNKYGEVVCPILSHLACPICGSTGKAAHTRRHCPLVHEAKQREIEAAIISGYDIDQF